jgi:hypothetical protein
VHKFSKFIFLLLIQTQSAPEDDQPSSDVEKSTVPNAPIAAQLGPSQTSIDSLPTLPPVEEEEDEEGSSNVIVVEETFESHSEGGGSNRTLVSQSSVNAISRRSRVSSLLLDWHSEDSMLPPEERSRSDSDDGKRECVSLRCIPLDCLVVLIFLIIAYVFFLFVFLLGLQALHSKTMVRATLSLSFLFVSFPSPPINFLAFFFLSCIHFKFIVMLYIIMKIDIVSSFNTMSVGQNWSG